MQTCENFDITYEGSADLRRHLRRAMCHMLQANYSDSDTTVLPPTEQLVLRYAKSVVTFATHFCHYWSVMDLGQRWEAKYYVGED